MPNLLKKFTLDKIIAATSPSVLEGYFHKKSLFLEIGNFKHFKNEHKADEYKQYIAAHILEEKAFTHKMGITICGFD